MTIIEKNDLMTREQAAEYLKLAPHTLAIWHCTKKHRIPTQKFGRRVYYKRQDLDKFFDEQTSIARA